MEEINYGNKMRIKLTEDQEMLIKLMSDVIDTGNSVWYKIPYWIKEDGEGNFEFVLYENLPIQDKKIMKDYENR